MSDKKSHALALRLDLQGLRAIAVTVVFLAHAGLPGFSGGYIGVDLFFILSGFLITGVLYKEHEASGQLNIAAFYSRRLKRLLPAMVLMIAVTIAASFILLPSFQAKAQVESAPFASLWLSNFYFTFAELDYFNELGQRDLFLHTWSLGVEEQFYLIWPFLFLLLVGFEKQRLSEKYDVWLRVFVGLCLVFILSLALSLYWTEKSPLVAFYQMPSRAWQFALGALLFFVAHRLELRGSQRSHFLIGLFFLANGIAAVGASVYLYHDRMPYPGWAALLPSFAAGFIILGGSWIPEGRNPLAIKPLVWLGNRSYSLYLWHWPVLLLFRAVHGDNLSNGLIVVAIAASILLTEFTYRCVERPFWKGSLSHFAPKKIILFGTLVMLLTFMGSFHAARQPILSEIDESLYISQKSRQDVPIIYRMPCDAWYADDKVQPCIFGPEDAQKTVVLLGDSIGAQWFSLVAMTYLELDWRLVVLTKSACPMVDHSYYYDRIKQEFSVCDRWRDKVLKRLPEWQPDVVVVGSYAGYPFSEEQWISGSQRIWGDIQKTGADVIVIPGTPTLGMDGPSCVSKEIQNQQSYGAKDCMSDRSEDVAYQVSGFLKEAASDMANVHVLDLNTWVCPSRICSALTQKGVVVFRDNQHLTNSFIESVVPRVTPKLRMILK